MGKFPHVNEIFSLHQRRKRKSAGCDIKHKIMKEFNPPYRRCHEKTSYVSNYEFFTLLHKWGDRGQTHRLEKLQ